MNNIYIYSCYDKKTKPYVNFLVKSCEKFKSNNNKIIYKLYNIDEIINPKINYENGSIKHAMILNNFINDFKNKKYVIIIDADIAILYPNWDDVVVKYLNEFKCFGFSRPKEKGFPSVLFFAFNTNKIDINKLDFMPKVNSNNSCNRYKINDEFESIFRKRPIGSNVKCDTGYLLPIIFEGNGFSLDCVLSSDKNHLLPINNNEEIKICNEKKEHQCEWHYNNLIFGTHKQASRSHEINSKYGNCWVNRIRKYTINKFNLSI